MKFLTLMTFCLCGIWAFSDSRVLNFNPSEPWAAVEERLFPKNSSDEFFTTDALLVIKEGRTLYEKYWNGNNENTTHVTWSITKSISSLVIGAAVLREDIHIHQSICLHRTTRDDFDCRMTWNHLLEWSSGLSFLEDYENSEDRTKSSVGQLLYGDGKNNSVEFILKHQQIYTPGTHYSYSSGDSSLLLGLLKHVYGEQRYSTLPQEFLFDPLSIKTAAIETDEAGQFLGGTSAYLTARDLSRIGQLVLDDGVWKGQRLVPRGWIRYLMQQNPQWRGPRRINDFWIPLRQWWKPNPHAIGIKDDPAFPKDLIVARGHWGQYLVIIPSKKMIIVRFGLDLKGKIEITQLIRDILKVTENVP